MKNDIVLFLIVLSFMRNIHASREIILKFSEEKSNILQLQIQNIRGKKDKKVLIRPSKFNNISISDFHFNKKNSKENKYICNKKNCNKPNGECINDYICKCFDNYFNFNNLSKSNSIQNFCKYKKKSQIIAFCLEIIFISGMGHFYMMRIIQGLIKLCLIISIMFVLFLFKRYRIEIKYISGPKENFLSFVLNLILTILFFIFMVFHIFDMMMLTNNSYLDGNGIPLISWNKGFGDTLFFESINH